MSKPTKNKKRNLRLENERERRGWTQAELAALVNERLTEMGHQASYDERAVRRWENEGVVPHPPTRRALCEVFGLDAAALGLVRKLGDEESALIPDDTVETGVATDLEDAYRCLRRARAETDRRKVVAFLEQGLKDLAAAESSVESRLVKAWIERELALESERPAVRTKHWKASLKPLRDDSKPADLRLTWHRGSIAVDAVQDRYCDLETGDRLQILNDALSQTDRAKVGDLTDQELGELLGRKASILRTRALFTARNSSAFVEPLKCAELAVARNSTDLGLVLELALCEWACARHERSEEMFQTRMQSAERHFQEAASLEEGRYALARFYRANWKSQQACVSFPASTPGANVRRQLREAHVLAEAVIELEYSKTPPAEYVEHRQQAINLLDLAISSGYGDARNIIDLALLHFFESGERSANTVLRDLMNGEATDWTVLADAVQNVASTDFAAQGLALGLTDPGTLNKLGTYVKDVLRDEAKAERFYRLAIESDRSNAIPVRNLADLLLRRDDPDAVAEGERLVLKAKALADKHFKWWKTAGANS